MARRTPTVLSIAAAALALFPRAGLAQSEHAARGSSRLELSIETPGDGDVVGDPAGMAFIGGSALAHYGEFESFDLVFVIDQSQSTMAPSGGDVNGDGVVSGWGCEKVPSTLGMFGTAIGLCRESQDSVLAAELGAVRTLLAQLDPRTTRVAVVAFSGDAVSSTPDANLLTPLTSEYASATRALDRIRDSGPRGGTNMQAGAQVATLELVRAGNADPGRRAQKIILFMSDGQPTLPMDQSGGSNRRVAIEAAKRAGKLGIRIDSYGIGPDALSDPSVLVEMARISDGIFTPVVQPHDLQSIFEQVSFSDVDTLRIVNRTTKSEAQYVQRSPDGSFSALLEMAPGRNTVEAYARASDGSEQTRAITVDFMADHAVPALAPRWLAARNRLLQNRLADLRERNVGVQAEQDAEMRRRLELRMQQEQAGRTRRLRVKPAPELPESADAPDRAR